MTERVLQGDCLQVLPTLPDNSVDLVLTDPPYFKVKGDAWDRQWDKPAQFLQWLDQVVEQLARVMKPNGSLYLFASPQMAARVESQIAVRLNVLCNIRWRKEQGRHKAACKEGLRSYFPASETIIFAEHYGSDGRRDNADDELRGLIFEPIRAYLDGEREAAGLSRRDFDAAWQAERGTKGEMTPHWFGVAQFCGLPTEAHYQFFRRVAPARFSREWADLRMEYEALRTEYEAQRRPFAVTADVPYTDVWDFPTVQAYPGKHPCEKPQALLRHIITASSKPGAVVLDAFAGTGSTGMACKALGREFIGIEMSEQYAATARARIAGMDAQPELFAA